MFSKVFIDVYSSKNLNNVSKLVEIALARCKDAEISPELYKLMPNIVFGKYDSFVCSAPWTRHPAAEILRQICMTFTVRGFHPRHFSWTKSFTFRRVDLPVSMNAMLTRDWKPFGVSSPGRLYQTPGLLTPDWQYSMSKLIWTCVLALIHLVVCVMLIHTAPKHWRYEMLQPRSDVRS